MRHELVLLFVSKFLQVDSLSIYYVVGLLILPSHL